MKKTALLSALLLSSVLTAQAFAAAQNPVLDYRRTLSLAIGQKNINLEAPRDMCFLDESDPVQGNLLDGMKAAAAQREQGQVVGVFTDCLAIANLAKPDNPLGMTNAGMVMWMNPIVGAKTDMVRDDYVAARATTLPQFVASNLTMFKSAAVDEKASIQDGAAMVGYIAGAEVEYQKFVVSGITAATVIEGLPLDFTMTRISDKKIEYKKELQDLMSSFVTQQITLNEKNK